MNNGIVLVPDEILKYGLALLCLLRCLQKGPIKAGRSRRRVDLQCLVIENGPLKVSMLRKSRKPPTHGTKKPSSGTEAAFGGTTNFTSVVRALTLENLQVTDCRQDG